MKFFILIALFLICGAIVRPATLIAQNQPVVTGRVVEDDTSTPIPGVHVYLDNTTHGAITDREGQFTLTAPSTGRFVLVARFVGYTEFRESVTLAAAGRQDQQIRLVESSILMDGVVVSATRERQSKSDVAASIGTVDADEIARTNPGHPSEIMGRIPGVWVNQTGGEGHMTAIRQPLTTDPVYLYLENGVPTRSTGFFNHNALYEINVPQAENIEVIKGPGTALYGSDAIGGVINVNSRSAPLTPTVSSTLEGGSFGFKRALMSAGTTIGPNGLRADLNLTDSDGWRDHTEYSRQSATLRWDRRVGNRTLVNTVASWSNIDQHPAGASAISEADFRKDASQNYTPISFRKVSAMRISSAIERYAGNTLFSATPFFRYNTMDLMPNWSLTYDPAIWETQNWSVGAQLKYRMDFEKMRGRVMVGADLDMSPGSHIETAVSPTREDGIFTSYTNGADLYDYDVTYRQASPYIHAELSPVEKLRLSAGLRFDVMGYVYDNNLSDVDTGSHRRPTSTTRSYTHPSPKLGLTYQVDPRMNVFASYRHAFRVPSEGQLFRQGSSTNTVDLKPVKADNYEAGIRGRLNPMVGYDLTAYTMDKTDDIVGYVFGDGTQGSVNAGRTSHRGVELGLQMDPVDVLSMYGSFSYAKHTFEDWRLSATEGYSGNEMDVAPRVTAQAGATVDVPVLQGASVTLEWNRIGSYWMDPANSAKYEGHDLLNLRLEVHVVRKISVWAKINNLTDELYADRATYNAFRGDEFAPGSPRTFNLALRYGIN